MSTTNTLKRRSISREEIPECTRILKALYIAVVVLLCIGTLFTTNMKVMSCDGVVIRNTNLSEFDALGTIPVIMPVLLLAIFLSRMSGAAKDLVYIVSFAFTAISHARSAAASYRWLSEGSGGIINFHFGLHILPLMLLAAFVLCFAFEHIPFKRIVTECVATLDELKEDEQET
ncbi:MAG: hypothetical protein IKU19_03265 [Clostridia bacterium]|nr:hypothetical protein [Clostridia bacterium]